MEEKDNRLSTRNHGGRSMSLATPTPPDISSLEIIKEGLLYVTPAKGAQKWKRRYFILTKKTLHWFKSPKDRAKSKSIQLFLSSCSQANVKGYKYTFQIISRAETILIRAESIEEMNGWLKVLQDTCAGLLSAGITPGDESSDQSNENNNNNSTSKDSTEKAENAITEDVKVRSRAVSRKMHSADSPSSGLTSTANKMKRLASIAELCLRSKNCADCGKDIVEATTYIVLLIGSFVCKECATILNELLGKHGLEIKSLGVDDLFSRFDPALDPTSMTFLGFMGNRKVNDQWEATVTAEKFTKPNANSPIEEKKNWINEKYIKKTFKGLKQGYLFVKSSETRKLKRFWVVLADTTLKTFTSKDEKEEDEVIQLQSCGVRVGEDPTEPESFSVISFGKRYKFQAVTYPAALEWANALKFSTLTLSFSSSPSSPAAGNILQSEVQGRDFRSRKVIPTQFQRDEVQPAPAQAVERLEGWNEIKGEVLRIEHQLRSEENEIFELETKISTSRQAIKGVIEDRYEFSKKYYTVNAVANPAANSPQIVRDKTTSATLAGNIEALILELLSPHQRDVNFKLAFILSYRSFVSPARIISLFCELFNNANTPKETKDEICSFIECWVGSHFYDLDGDGDAIRHILSFTDDSLQLNGYLPESQRIRIIIVNHMMMKLKVPKIVIESAPPSIEPVLPHSFDNFDDLEIARQLTLIDKQLFQAIRPREFLNRGWLEEDKATESPNIIAINHRYHRMVNWVLTTILRRDENERSHILEKFINIAQHCVTLRNFNSALVIMEAIEDTLILHFEGTWEGISDNIGFTVFELRKLLSKEENYRRVKEEINSSQAPAIPYLPIYLDEILAIDNELPDLVEGSQLINFDKRMKTAKLIAEVQQLQQLAKYNLRTVFSIQNLLYTADGLSRSNLLNLANLN